MIQLRPYQSEQIRLSRESFSKGHKRIIICSPTGSGKSILIAEMVRASYEKGKRIFIFTHRMELFKSTLAHIGRAQIPCVELKSGMELPSGDYRVLLSMEKTFWNRIKKGDTSVLQPDIILCDEIHFNNFTKIINHFSSAFLIGYSATPQGKHIHKIYTDIIQNVDVPDLIKSGHLCNIRAWQMADATKDEFGKMRITKGEFDTKELFQHYNTHARYKGVLDGYKKKCLGMKGIIFCVNVEHTKETFRTFYEEWINVFMVHSKMSESERIENIKSFELSRDGIMVNCGILCVGYDHPPIKFVIQDFATTSLPKFLQTIGRASRPGADKDTFYVLDFGRNHERHGLWNMPRTWSLKAPEKRKEQPAAIKTCPSCGAILFASVRICEYCKYEFEIQTTELREGILVEIETNCPIELKGKRISELDMRELIMCEQTKKLKPSYVWRVLRTRGSDSLEEYQIQKGYSSGWLWRQQSDSENIGFKDYILK